MAPSGEGPKQRSKAFSAINRGHTAVRKRPRQPRSQTLVRSLLEATARILVDHGWDALTTNHVAELAGVSVGSLYQYFPNKDALVAGLIEELASEMTTKLVGLGPKLSDAPIALAISTLVNASLSVAREDAPLYRAVLLELPRIGALEIFEQLNQRLADVLAEWISQRRDELDVEDPSLTAYVIVTSLDALTDHALLLRPTLLESRRFVRQLERLVAGCLGVSLTSKTKPSVPRKSARRRAKGA